MYVNTPILDSFYLSVGSGHELYVETAGNPQGIPVIFLHGGPGGHVSEASRRFFDPEAYFIILFDQRGTGQSKPFLSLEANTIFHSVEDMECLREHLGIEAWYVFGGSYGSTLALTYAIHHPDRVKHLILRGIFLGRQEDIDWLYQAGASYFVPEAFDGFKNFIPEQEQGQLVEAYYQRLTQGKPAMRQQASKLWADWESSVINLVPQIPTGQERVSPSDMSYALLEAHYFVHGVFGSQDQYILEHSDRLQEIPMDIVHGRYDINCRPIGAYLLKRAVPQAKLHLIEKGAHNPYERPMMEKLLAIMNHLKHAD